MLYKFYDEVYSNTQLLNYWLALLVYRASVEQPFGTEEGVKIFLFVSYFAEQMDEISTVVWSVYAPVLLLEISKCDSAVLVEWAKKLEEYVRLNELQIPIGWLCERLKSEILEKVNIVISNPSLDNCKVAIEAIELAVKFESNLEELANFALVRIIKHYFQMNDLDNFYASINIQKKADINIINSLLNSLSSLKTSFTRETKRLIRKIEKSIKKLRVKIPKVPFTSESLDDCNIDLKTIVFPERPLYYHVFEQFTIRVYSGTNAQGLSIIAKIYENFIPNFDFSNIENEQKIMTFLSNRAEVHKTFIKLYHIHRNQNQIIFYMQNGGTSLMNYMTEVKNQGNLIQPQIIKSWIITLLESFAWLSSNCIYHCDIKPHNILVNPKDLTLKIIDFGISKFLTNCEATYSPTVAYPIQGTEGYMSPELVVALDRKQQSAMFKPGKSDVFSLGITILQMITLERLLGLNSNEMNEQLLNRVEGLNCELWIKQLLKVMLNKDRTQRPSFNKCLQFIPETSRTIIT